MHHVNHSDTSSRTNRESNHKHDEARAAEAIRDEHDISRGRNSTTYEDAFRINCVSDPTHLSAPYTRVLLSAFLLLPTSSFASMPGLHVGVLGVGGGALPSFLQHFFARLIARLDLVDIEPSCLVAAVRDMGLRHGDGVAATTTTTRTYLYASDAQTFLQRVCEEGQESTLRRGLQHSLPRASSAPRHAHKHTTTSASKECFAGMHENSVSESAKACARRADVSAQPSPDLFDVLLVDLFVGSELATSVSTRSFISQCQRALRWHGVAAFNLPMRDAPFVQRCQDVFGATNVCTIPVPRSSNVVVLARRVAYASGNAPAVCAAVSHRSLYRRAEQLQRLYHLPYDLANHMPWWWRLW